LIHSTISLASCHHFDPHLVEERALLAVFAFPLAAFSHIKALEYLCPIHATFTFLRLLLFDAGLERFYHTCSPLISLFYLSAFAKTNLMPTTNA
jgi:hypothetical protein